MSKEKTDRFSQVGRDWSVEIVTWKGAHPAVSSNIAHWRGKPWGRPIGSHPRDLTGLAERHI
jgi:hypothetical protein